ncbi:ankyrin repeat domain-containing protein [Aspergillus stella-maris]|uniref:ankyrin repeat domain-containing protein n=1 Tax=Aspergillus stella-maris TaxID=1810926 RepID=UPI003CCCD5A5
MTRLLHEKNADIHTVDKHKQSALFWAAKHSVKTTRILLEAGANVHGLDEYGKTPFFAAMSEACFEITNIEFRSANQPDADGQMRRSVAGKQADICRLLLEYGASDHDNEGNPAYRFALKEGLGEILHIFIEKGVVPIDEVDDEGFSLVSRAVRKGHDSVVKVLVDAGADTIKSDNTGKTTPLHLCEHDELIGKLYSRR